MVINICVAAKREIVLRPTNETRWIWTKLTDNHKIFDRFLRVCVCVGRYAFVGVSSCSNTWLTMQWRIEESFNAIVQHFGNIYKRNKRMWRTLNKTWKKFEKCDYNLAKIVTIHMRQWKEKQKMVLIPRQIISLNLKRTAHTIKHQQHWQRLLHH